MRREVAHNFTPKQIRLIRYARARWHWEFAKIAEHYAEVFPKGSTPEERTGLVELVIRGIIGAADDQMIEAPFPPSANSPKRRELVPKKCAEGHRYHGEVCFTCYVAAMPKPDAEALEIK